MKKYNSISQWSEGAADLRKDIKPSSLEQVLGKVMESDKPRSRATEGQGMKRIKVRSNSARSSTQVFGDRGELVLKFDSEGVASFPENQLPLMKSIARVRPGRYTFIDEAEAPKSPMPSEEALEVLAKLKAAEADDAAEEAKAAEGAKVADEEAAKAEEAKVAEEAKPKESQKPAASGRKSKSKK